MSMDYIRRTYSVPAKRGTRVRFAGYREGRIVSARAGYLRILFDDGRRGTVHPTWMVEYLT